MVKMNIGNSRCLSRFCLGFLLLGAIAVGCDRRGGDRPGSEPAKQLNKGESGGKDETAAAKKHVKPKALIDRLDATSVVVRVNGTAITKGRYSAYERFRVGLWCAANKEPLNTKDEELKKFKVRGRMEAMGELLKRELLRQYAEKKHIAASEEMVANQRNKLLKTLHKQKQSFDEAAASFGADGSDLLRWMADSEALREAVIKSFATNDIFTVTEAEISNRVQYVEKFNKRIDELNASNRVVALKARAEILEGTNGFAAVAAKYAQTNAWEGADWQSLSLDELEADDPLAQWLAKAKVGDVSEPMVLDDGMAIVGLAKQVETEPATDENPAVYEYYLVRCYFYYYEKLDEIVNRKDLVADMIENRRDLVMQELEKELFKGVKLEFPNGNNLFEVPKPKKKARKNKEKVNLKKTKTK